MDSVVISDSNPQVINNKPFQNYLNKYWAKYPKEQEIDPTIEEIKNFIDNGGKFFLKDNNFILYTEHNNHVEILLYCCDMGDLPRKEVYKTLKNHKEFIDSFNKPIYSIEIKDLFKRDYLVKKENNVWRWL